MKQREEKKKIIAAMSAVMQYLDEEKQVIAEGQQNMTPAKVSSSWASYGRQVTMSNGQLMQRRLLRRR